MLRLVFSLLRPFLLFAFLVSSTVSGAQDMLQRDSVSVSGSLDQTTLLASNRLTNNASEAKAFRYWLTLRNGPDAWDFRVCDTLACRAMSRDTFTLVLAPGAMSPLNIEAMPNRVAGTAEIEWTVQDPATGEEQVSYYFFSNQTSSTSALLLLDISIYPNPTADFLYVDTQGRSLYAQLFDRHGQRVRNYLPQEVDRIDLRGLPSGAYVLRLYSPEGLQLGRIVVKE